MLKSLTTFTPLTILLCFIMVVSGIAGYYFETGWPAWFMALIGALLGFIATLLFYVIIQWLARFLSLIPLKLTAAVLGASAALVLIKQVAFRWPDQVYYPAALLFIIFFLILFFSIRKLAIYSRNIPAMMGVAATLLFLLGSVFWLQREGDDPYAEEYSLPFSNPNIPTLASQGVINPASVGEYSVNTFTYGNGTDEHREEFAEGAKYKTPLVDATRLLPDWKGKKKKWRERYWGFGVSNFPLNGRVYMPEGEGPFPIILVVHGNHSMLEYSDGGYGYLGELLASRGLITVSVDQNFINGHWSGDFRGKEMPARAWLLLKHLEQWKVWNNMSQHDLSGKIDLNNILLIGHSRGGEAVSIAAAFNKLPYFPDDAQEKFDFNFGIRGVVSLAPTDYRYHRQIILQDVNYLSLQGSYDADEVSFWGMRPFHRLAFSDSSQNFKAGVYLHRANHGQFNTSWGRADFGGPMQWLLNTQPMMSGEEQREAAKIFISAFAEATVHNQKQYLSLFKNPAVGRDWLPVQYYLTHFKKADAEIITNFEEDIDLTTASNGAVIQAHNFKVWREENLKTRDEGSQENNAVVLGWDYRQTIHPDSVARYELHVEDSALFSSQLDSLSSLLITVAAGNPQELENENQETREEPESDLSIVLTDREGQQAKVKLSDSKRLAPRLKTRFTKLAFLDKELIGDEWEVQPETFHVPLANFKANNPTVNLRQLEKISMVFDQTPYGMVVVDDIGFGTEP